MSFLQNYSQMNISRFAEDAEGKVGKRSKPVPFPSQMDSDEEAERQAKAIKDEEEKRKIESEMSKLRRELAK